MYLDGFPELAYARLVRKRARGVPIRDGGRAVAIAWMADGTVCTTDTMVRFDVTEGEKAPRRLADAFLQTNAGSIRFFGGDDVIRGSLKGLELDLQIEGSAYVFRHAPPLPVKVTLREGSMRDSLVLGEMAREQSAHFDDPKVLIAEINHEAVGVAITDVIDKNWSELRIAVHQPHRGNGFGAAIAASAADRLVSTEGRLVCAGIHNVDERGRLSLERGGFRLVDYYFVASKKLYT
ncbi:MAG TPA: GNAT family N-acetyltransferase [Candidatus Lustribacter sp.]|jgi:GNAT superfamily N-acetyltransferase|nr:GNAT family N-acetyltransferase [Candidatus Lustribacter sp.]